MIFVAYWKQLLGIGVALVLAVTAYHAGGTAARADLAKAQAQWAQDSLAAAEAARASESAWRQELQLAQEGYQNEIESLRRRRNPGAGAAVRVCAPAADAGASSSTSATDAAGTGQAATAAGVVPAAVPAGADIGPMLRGLVERGDELAAQVRALQAAWPK